MPTSRADRVYRALLRLYPTEFRDEYGREMTQMFRDRARHERPSRVWLDVARDLLATVPKEQAHVLMNDLRYAVRTIRRAPGFSAAVMLTVALAIAGNTAMFTVVNAVLIRPLPFDDPHGMIQVAEKNDRLNLPNFGASVLNFVSWREQTRAFDQLAAIGFMSFNLSGAGEPEQFVGNRISPALMNVLRLAPVVGRGFTEAEEKPGAPAVAMIGERLWARRFGRDASLVGRALTLNGAPVTVVGIAPAALSLFSGGDIYVPLTIDPAKEIRLNHVIFVAGRLRPGVTIQQAQAECDTIAAGMAHTYPEMRDWGIRLLTFFETFVTPQLEAALLVLLAAVGFVLLIACANIANLLLARATARRREMAVRTALGASRSRLLRQLLVESVTLSIFGGAAGITGAVWVVRAINVALPPNLLPIPEVHIDATVLAFALGLTLATGIIFGMAPASYAARADVNEMLKTGRGAGAVGGRLRRGLAAAELALATVLVVGAGLLVQTFLNLQHARLGFESSGLLTFQLAPPPSTYTLSDKAPMFYRALLDSIAAGPGVRSAAVSSGIPFGQGNYTTSPMMTVGPSALPPDTSVPIDWRIVSPGYFRTMAIPLLRGRDFTDRDGPAMPLVTIVSQATAKKFWGGEDPLGRTLHRPNDSRTYTVVGVVGDVRSTTLSQESPALYYPMAARVWPLMDIVVRTDGPPAALLPVLRQKVHELDAGLPLATVRTMEEWVSSSATQPRLSAALVGVFAVVAVLIAAIGIYGVLAYSVNQRTREIGLRIALGARADGVVRLIVKEGMVVAFAGIGAGLVAAIVLGRAVGSLVYGIAPRDPLTFAGVAAALALVALAACSVPAKRASRVDPMVALREE
jgi:putative ABC transport system permease protein